MEQEDRRRMALILRAVTQEKDWTLEQLARWADAGLGVSVTLLVDGQWVEGELTRPEAWADSLDESLSSALEIHAQRLEEEHGSVTNVEDVLGRITAGDLEELRTRLEKRFREVVDERRDRDAAARAELQALDADAETPEDLAFELDVMEEPVPVLTLSNVVVGTPPTYRHIPMLRVVRAHVGAWHLGRRTPYNGSDG